MKAKLFQASTSEVYGDPTLPPQPEHDWGNVNPIGPRSCYTRRTWVFGRDARPSHPIAALRLLAIVGL